MATRKRTALVLRDAEGSYYLLSRQTLERCRVPAERIAEIEEAIGGGEVVGFAASANRFQMLGQVDLAQPTASGARSSRQRSGVGKAVFDLGSGAGG